MIMADGKHREKMLNDLLDKIMSTVDGKYDEIIKALVEEEIQSYSNRELRELLGIDQ